MQPNVEHDLSDMADHVARMELAEQVISNDCLPSTNGGVQIQQATPVVLRFIESWSSG
jgi:hypothetical protein